MQYRSMRSCILRQWSNWLSGPSRSVTHESVNGRRSRRCFWNTSHTGQKQESQVSAIMQVNLWYNWVECHLWLQYKHFYKLGFVFCLKTEENVCFYHFSPPRRTGEITNVSLILFNNVCVTKYNSEENMFLFDIVVNSLNPKARFYPFL